MRRRELKQRELDDRDPIRQGEYENSFFRALIQVQDDSTHILQCTPHIYTEHATHTYARAKSKHL
jgi:hypothetical protein